MAEGPALEKRYPVKNGIVGSNPTLSAIILFWIAVSWWICKKSIFHTKTRRHLESSVESIQVFLCVLRDLCMRAAYYESIKVGEPAYIPV